MEENELYDRIGETDLNPTYKDGQPYMHTDINQMLGILKTAINENYYDIQRLLNGVKTVGNSEKLDGATLSRYIDEELQSDDNKIPSSQQAKAYMDALFAGYSAPVRGVDYWTESDQQQIVSDTASNVIEEITPDLEEALDAKANINDVPTKVSDLTNDSEFITSLEMQESQSEQDTKINKKPYYFNNVAEMKAYNLSAGDMVITKGYYEENDGGNAKYYIVNNNTLNDDGGSVIDLENGLKACLIIENNILNVKQFGAKGNANYFNETDNKYYVDNNYTILANDDTEAIQNAINTRWTLAGNIFTPNYKRSVLFFPSAKYLIKNSLYLSNNFDVDGNFSTIYPTSDFSGDYMFATNVKKTDNSDWIIEYPHRTAYFKNFKPYDYNKLGIGFLLLGDTREIKNITATYMGWIVHNLSKYLDSVQIRNINISTPIGGNYQIEMLNGAGDCNIIDSVHVYGSLSNATTGNDDYCTGTNQFFNLINLSNHQTTISNCINGRIRLGVGNYNINNFHCEFGQLILENCEASISNSIFVNHPENYSNIYVVNTNNNAKSGYSTLLENVGFFIEPHLYNFDNTLRSDIDISNSSGQVTLINCYRKQLSPYYPEYLRYRTLPILKVKNNEIYYCRNQIEKFLNGNPNVYYECIPNASHTINRGNYIDSYLTYNGDLGSTIYKIYELYDNDRKLATSFGTTSSIEAVESKLIFIKIDGLASNSLLYIEKEVDNKIYYAIVPLMLGDRLTDYGKNICGIPWTLRESNETFTQIKSYKRIGQYVELRNNTLPSVGTWQKGDKINYFEPLSTTAWHFAYNTNTGIPSWERYLYTPVS